MLHVCDEYVSEDGKTKHENGILFEGDEGRIFVNREKLTGKPVEEMTKDEQKKLDEEVVKLYGGKQPGNHMQNFFDCVASRGTPISDVETHHRTMTSLPPVQHRPDARPRAEVGSRQGTIRGRRAGHDAHVTPETRQVFLEGDNVSLRTTELAGSCYSRSENSSKRDS